MPVSITEHDLRVILRQKVINALSANGGQVRGSSHISLLNFLTPKMRDLPVAPRELRRQLGAVIDVMKGDEELWVNRGKWCLGERLIESSRVAGPVGGVRKRPPYRNEKVFHGRSNRDHRNAMVPTSIT